MTPEDVHNMPIEDRLRRIKILTPGEYPLHAWLDTQHNNGLLLDTILLTVDAGGKLISGVPRP